MDLGSMSDPESAATAAHFIAKVARKPGSKEEVAAFSRAGRACPDVMNRAVANADRDRARRTKSEARIQSIESRWREERGKSVKQEARIMRLQQRVKELEKDNEVVRVSHRMIQGDKEKQETKTKEAEAAKASAERAIVRKKQEHSRQIRSLKLKQDVAKVAYKASRQQLETEVAKLKEQLQAAEDAANASDSVYNKKVAELKDKLAAMEADADNQTKKLAENEAATASLRLKLVRAQLKVRAANQQEHELRRARDEVARYERHCRRMADVYGGRFVISTITESTAPEEPAAGGEGARIQVGPSSRRRPAGPGSMEDIVRTAIKEATAAVEQQSGPSTSTGRQRATAGLLPHTVRAILDAEHGENSDEEITVIAVKRPLAGVVGRKKGRSAGSDRSSKAAGSAINLADITSEPVAESTINLADVTTEPESD